MNLSGHHIEYYQILGEIGRGGMAVVYKAKDTIHNQIVAIKVFEGEGLPENILRTRLKRFEREAAVLSKLSYPHIAPFIGHGSFNGVPYLVMEYLPHGTLLQLMGKPMYWKKALTLLMPLAKALAYAHGKGIIHRDVKPSNILIAEDETAWLSDFGIIKISDDETTMDLTGTNGMLGSPEYMSPEQGLGKPLDERTDIYSLGMVLYELVAGIKPFSGETGLEIFANSITTPLTPPSKYAPDLPNGLEQIILKAISRDANGRFRTMHEFANSLESVLKSSNEKGTSGYRKWLLNRFFNYAVRPLGYLLIALIGISLLVLFVSSQLSKGEQANIPSASIINVQSPSLGIPSGGGIELTATEQILPSPVPTTIPTFAVGSLVTRESDGMKMAYIPEGEFTMGSGNGMEDEKPVHKVYLDAFWIDETEITNQMYAICVNTGYCQPPLTFLSATHAQYYTDTFYKFYPVVQVTYTQAATYCNWAGARLPTEAQWEKAARGTDERVYPWGIDLPDRGFLNYGEFIGDTTQVGSYPFSASPYGILDMAGNVNEWVSDWYDGTYYQHSPQRNPLGPDNPVESNFRILRGGSWRGYDLIVRSSFRNKFNEDKTSDSIGFRCAKPDGK